MRLKPEKGLKTALIFQLLAIAATLGWSEPPAVHLIQEFNANHDFIHGVGHPGSKGWELDYRRDKPGFAISGLKNPLLLEEGPYRMTFNIRRGHYPNKGLFHKTFGLFRIEIWDVTANLKLIDHELQIGDFPKPNRYEPRWLDFSMTQRKGHSIEPRIYWVGLGNGEIGTIKVERFVRPDLKTLEEKAERLGDRQEGVFIENGFVVSRKPSGEPDETGDATTYTGFYVASLAWKYAVTKDALAYQALENGLAALHHAIKGDIEKPILTRYVEEDGTPFPKSPSKDVYTAFFLAYSAAYPQIENISLKNQMKEDMERIATRFLTDGLTVKGGSRDILSLTPYFTEEEIRDGIHKLISDKKMSKKFIKTLNQTKTYLPFTELWPGMKEAIKAIQSQNEEKLYAHVVPAMNGIGQLLERVRELLREQYRDDLFPKRIRQLDYPGKRLLNVVNDILNKFPNNRNNKRFERPSDLRLLASNALISLHIVRTALEITRAPHLKEYYQSNLFTQDELLKTALDWYSIEEDLLRLTAGNGAADRHRRGYLTTLALYNLIQLEKNPETKKQYQGLLKREWAVYRREDNPLMEAINIVCGNHSGTDFILRALEMYPEERTGFGIEYWKNNGKKIAEKWGGGENEGYAVESLPVSVRPKDSFLWQRNSRRLEGDTEKEYPATDYLFLYWFCRYHGLIGEAPPEGNAFIRNNE